MLPDNMIHSISSYLILGSSQSDLMKGVGQLVLFENHYGGPGLDRTVCGIITASLLFGKS